MKKLISLLFGIIIIALTVWFGLYSMDKPNLVLIFGAISAIFIPFGIFLISNYFNLKDRETLFKLSKIPEIKKLINKAKTHEDKIEALKSQQEYLEEAIEYEAKRRTLNSEKRIYINHGNAILKEINRIENELLLLTSAKTKKPVSFIKLIDKLENIEDYESINLFGKKLKFKKSSFNYIAPYGSIFYELIIIFSKLQNKSRLPNNKIKKEK